MTDETLDEIETQQEACRRKQRGLTLVELMVVIVIIGLLTTIVVVNVIPAGDTAKVKKAQADIGILSTALDQFRLDMSQYPTTDQGLEVLSSAPSSISGNGSYRPGGYIRKLPLDPWGNPYQYIYPGELGDLFDIYSFGADGKEGGEGLNADIGNWQ